MWIRSNPSENINFTHRMRTTGRRNFKIALLSIFMVATSIVPQPASAKPAAVYMWTQMMIRPNGAITLCKGEKKEVNVFLAFKTFKFSNLFSNEGWSYPPNQLINVRSQRSHVASINPGSTLIQPDPVYMNPRALFVISATEVGTTEITFSDEGHGSTGVVRNRPRAGDETLTVTVKKCKFKISYSNKWVVPHGFIDPRIDVEFSTEVTPDNDGKFEVSNILLLKTVEPTIRPGNLCTYKTTPYASTVDVTGGRVDWSRNKVSFALDFEPVKVYYDWNCKSAWKPVGVWKDMHGSLWGLTFTDYPASGFTVKAPQDLVASSVVTSPADVTVVREYVE